jgi:hypothetical protein
LRSASWMATKWTRMSMMEEMKTTKQVGKYVRILSTLSHHLELVDSPTLSKSLTGLSGFRQLQMTGHRYIGHNHK